MRTNTTTAAGRVKTRTGWCSTKSDHAEAGFPEGAQVGIGSTRISFAMTGGVKREEALADLLPRRVREIRRVYFFSVSAMIRFMSAAALLAAARTSPPWMEVTMAAPTASRTSATATTGGFQKGVPTFEPSIRDSPRSEGTLALPLGSFHTDSRAPRTPRSLWTLRTWSLLVAHCMNSQAAFWFLLVLGMARPHTATVEPYWPLGP